MGGGHAGQLFTLLVRERLGCFADRANERDALIGPQMFDLTYLLVDASYLGLVCSRELPQLLLCRVDLSLQLTLPE